MTILEKTTQEDLILYEIIRNPVLCTEFINNIDKLDFEKPFVLDWYQKNILCDFSSYVSIIAARAVGKTISLSSLIIWLLIYNVFPEDYYVYTVPNKVHLEPVFLNLTRMFRSNSFLKWFIEPKKGINNSDFSISLTNNAKLMCRIAGTTGTGANVIGLHTPFILLDESGVYPWGTWIELQPSINSWQRGSRLMTSGVPTGVREKNVNYHNDMEDSNFSKHRISAFMNPRYSKEANIKDLETYGGKDGDDYIHMVLGQHGKPVFALFDRAAFSISNYPIYRIEIDGISEKDNIGNIYSKIALIPTLPDKSTPCIIGADLGYTEPTAIWIMYEDDQRRLKFHAKIRLTKVAYPVQEKIIDAIDTKFNPVLIGIDRGSAGISVIQNLLEHNDYVQKNYQKVIYPIDFSSYTLLGIDSSGEEIKEKTKPLLVSVLQEYVNNHKVVFSSTDTDMIVELERMTYTKTPTGDIVYRTLTQRGGKRGEDHFTSALLCATGAYYMTNDLSLSRKEKKVMNISIWT